MKVLDSIIGCALNGVATTAAVLPNGDQIAGADVVLRVEDGSRREGGEHFVLYEQTSLDALTAAC